MSAPSADRPDAVRDAFDELAARDAVARLHARDASLWSADQTQQDAAANRLGWLDVADGRGWADRLKAFRREVADAGLTRVVLAGMGGSSLAPEVFAKVFAAASDPIELVVLDSTHPVAVRAALDDADLAHTLVIVSSKSGTTEETLSFGARAAALVDSADHLAAITDPGSELAEQAEVDGWRACFLNPPDIGGRYSALSLFGMMPAALVGVDIDQVWARATRLLAHCGTDTPLDGNPAAELAAFMGGWARQGRDKLTVVTPLALEPLGDWVEQLVAESTGKDGTGIVPIVGEPVAAPDGYGADRAFVEVRLADEPVAGVAELTAAGHPVLTITVADRHGLGAEFVRWELATAWAAALLGVNPFDEPNVAESKANTRAVLSDVVGGTPLPAPEDGDVEGLLESLGPGDYFSVQSYLAPSPAAAQLLTTLRGCVRDAAQVATTVGWGPRFLHSTGQLHKGGPDSLVALQIVDAPHDGPDIPGRDYDFATLVRAQALGDLRSLREHGRRVAQVGIDRLEGLERLVQRVEDALRTR